MTILKLQEVLKCGDCNSIAEPTGTEFGTEIWYFCSECGSVIKIYNKEKKVDTFILYCDNHNC